MGRINLENMNTIDNRNKIVFPKEYDEKNSIKEVLSYYKKLVCDKKEK